MAEDGEGWNMAEAYYRRIDSLLTLCDKYHMEKNLLKWFDAIYALYKEIYPKMSPDDKKKANDLLKKATDKKNTGLRNPTKCVSILPFVDIEMFIRECMEKKNMLTPKGDDPTRAYRDG